MEDDIKDGDRSPPVINGYAVPVRDSPGRPSNKPGHNAQMDSEEYDMGPAGDMQEDEDEKRDEFDEDEGVGPLIPPPQGFRGQSRTGRAVSQSIPQVRY